MKPIPIIEIILNPELGKVTIYGDEDGCWIELSNGQETVETPVLLKHLDALRHSILLKEDEIRAAETPRVPA